MILCKSLPCDRQQSAVQMGDGTMSDLLQMFFFSRTVPHSESLDRDEIDILILPALPVLMIICCDWRGIKLDAWRDVVPSMCFTAVLKMELWFNRPGSTMQLDKQESDQTTCCFKTGVGNLRHACHNWHTEWKSMARQALAVKYYINSKINIICLVYANV